VQGETRVVPVQAELDNFGGQLKPGMFAQLEVLTDQTPTAICNSNSAVVEANGKKLVYVKMAMLTNAEVTLGQTSGTELKLRVVYLMAIASSLKAQCNLPNPCAVITKLRRSCRNLHQSEC